MFTKNGSMKRYHVLEVDFGNKLYWRNKLAEQKGRDEERRRKRMHGRFGSGDTEAKRPKGNFEMEKDVQKAYKRYEKHVRKHVKEPHRMSNSFGKTNNQRDPILRHKVDNKLYLQRAGKSNKIHWRLLKAKQRTHKRLFSAYVKSSTTKEKRTGI